MRTLITSRGLETGRVRRTPFCGHFSAAASGSKWPRPLIGFHQEKHFRRRRMTVKIVRALDRGLDVLRIIQEFEGRKPA